MNDPTLPLFGLSPVSGKTVVAKFDGGHLSSDGGVLLLREVEQKLRIAERLAGCLRDPPHAAFVTHSLSDILRFRLLMIGAGYEDGSTNHSRDATNGGRLSDRPTVIRPVAPSDQAIDTLPTICRTEGRTVGTVPG